MTAAQLAITLVICCLGCATTFSLEIITAEQHHRFSELPSVAGSPCFMALYKPGPPSSVTRTTP